MLIVTLTTIPPRFHTLPDVLASLRAQTCRPDRIVITIPRTYRRFPGVHALPPLPEYVDILTPADDPGPAGKILPAARAFAGQDCDILYCDDDCAYAPHWACAFLEARKAKGQNTVIAGSGFDVVRLGLGPAKQARRGKDAPAGLIDVAQGFCGVLVRPEHFDHITHNMPPMAWPVDDVWLSGNFARLGLPIWKAKGIRDMCTPRSQPGDLQGAVVRGATRAQSNRACAAYVQKNFGVWQGAG